MERFERALLDHMGFDHGLLGTAGVSVAGHPGRAESRVTVAYLIGEHVFITCDPAVEDMLTAATAAMAPTHEAWTELAPELGGDYLGVGRQQLLTTHDLPDSSLPAGMTIRSLSRDDPSDLALLARLVEISSEDDLDEAELEMDNLDEHMDAVLDADGQIASLASSRPFDMAPAFGDIGILTRTDSRSLGLGSAAVSALCRRLVQADIEPLYRCDEDNIGSVELSRGLLFAPVAMVKAYRFPVA